MPRPRVCPCSVRSLDCGGGVWCLHPGAELSPWASLVSPRRHHLSVAFLFTDTSFPGQEVAHIDFFVGEQRGMSCSPPLEGSSKIRGGENFSTWNTWSNRLPRSPNTGNFTFILFCVPRLRRGTTFLTVINVLVCLGSHLSVGSFLVGCSLRFNHGLAQCSPHLHPVCPQLLWFSYKLQWVTAGQRFSPVASFSYLSQLTTGPIWNFQ